MLIAKLKKETNIVEYVIYMFQIEDIIRSLKFDMALIDQVIVQKFDHKEETKRQIAAWYEDLVLNMNKEGIQKSGHLSSLKEVISGLNILHNTLLTTIQDKKYLAYYEKAKPILNDLIKKSGGKGSSNEIEVALNGIYGLLVLRLGNQNVSEETQEGLEIVSRLLAYLAVQYREMKMGNLNLSNEQRN